MQNNSQGRHDRLDPKATPRPESTDIPVDNSPADEAAPAEAVKKTTTGVVTECVRLNIRKTPAPDGEIVAVVDLLTDVVVDLENSTDDFYKISTATGVDGFCMKKYIALRR